MSLQVPLRLIYWLWEYQRSRGWTGLLGYLRAVWSDRTARPALMSCPSAWFENQNSKVMFYQHQKQRSNCWRASLNIMRERDCDVTRASPVSAQPLTSRLNRFTIQTCIPGKWSSTSHVPNPLMRLHISKHAKVLVCWEYGTGIAIMSRCLVDWFIVTPPRSSTSSNFLVLASRLSAYAEAQPHRHGHAVCNKQELVLSA